MADSRFSSAKRFAILIIGENGDGKSTIINALRDPSASEPAECGRTRVTQKVKHYLCKLKDGTEFYLLDTPGLGGYHSPAAVFGQIQDFLASGEVPGGIRGVVVTSPVPECRTSIGKDFAQVMVNNGFVNKAYPERDVLDNIILCGTKLDKASEEDQKNFMDGLEGDLSMKATFFENHEGKTGPCVMVGKHGYEPLREAIEKLPEVFIQCQSIPDAAFMHCLGIDSNLPSVSQPDKLQQMQQRLLQMQQHHSQELSEQQEQIEKLELENDHMKRAEKKRLEEHMQRVEELQDQKMSEMIAGLQSTAEATRNATAKLKKRATRGGMRTWIESLRGRLVRLMREHKAVLDALRKKMKPKCPRSMPPPIDWDQGNDRHCLYHAMATCLRDSIFVKYVKEDGHERINFDPNLLLKQLLALTEDKRSDDSWLNFEKIMACLQESPIAMPTDSAELQYLVTASFHRVPDFELAYTVQEENHPHMVIICHDSELHGPGEDHAVVCYDFGEWKGRRKMSCQNSYGLKRPVEWVCKDNFRYAYLLEPSVALVNKSKPFSKQTGLTIDSTYEEFARYDQRTNWAGVIQIDPDDGSSKWAPKTKKDRKVKKPHDPTGFRRAVGSNRISCTLPAPELCRLWQI